MSARPLSRATFTGSVTRTDTQSLTQNTGVSFRGGCRDRVGYERREHTENIGLNSLVVSVTPTEAARERKEKSARSLILPWFREFVPVPVRQLNNSAGNLVNKPRTQIPLYKHIPKIIHSFIFGHGIFFIKSVKYSNKGWNISCICMSFSHANEFFGGSTWK